ncbi:MAG: PQQ-dependent sugar dehydrogenase [Desulfurococcales archaeon]|nr:PQQ-dependent sugar dehydrogenase [Desulfurococcales archaeon]
MKRRDFIKLTITILILSSIGGVAYRFLGADRRQGDQRSNVYVDEPGLEDIVSIENLAVNLKVPWSVVPLGDNRYIISERPGRIIAIVKGEQRLVVSFDVAAVGEAGLLGLALHPDYPSRPYLYAYMSYYRDSQNILNRVVRIRIDPKTLKATAWNTIIDMIPGGYIHDGGRIKFGPDGMLYITTGDAAKPELSQRLDSTAGKILRLEDDGGIPVDNPFNGSPIYSYGHRNPQGIDWSPINQIMIASEHGPVGHDEINLIHPGGNYGWPIVRGKANREEYIDPILESGPNTTWAPSGISFIKGEMFKELKGDLLVACLRGQRLLRIRIPDKDNAYIVEEPFTGKFGRIRDVAIDEDGSILLLTSNTDGRGRPRQGDDKLIRLYTD